MNETPCRYCSSEERKKVREEFNVNSCKTVCKKYLPFELERALLKQKIDKDRRNRVDWITVKDEAVRGVRRRR